LEFLGISWNFLEFLGGKMRTMLKWLTMGLLTIGLFGLNLASAQKLTAENWKTSPKIKAIQVIQSEVNNLEFKNVDTQDLGGCNGLTEARVLNSDAQNNPRAYYLETYTKDVYYGLDYIYDQAGKLRYAEIQGAAGANDTINWTFYFDDTNQVLWKEVKQQGAYQWIDPLEKMPFNALETFANIPKCATKGVALGDGTPLVEPVAPPETP
jgi:hypothetical protein